MSGNSFGSLFKITTWGESHGPAIGVVIDGCPAGLKISEKIIQKDLNRRKPKQSNITTQRKEEDKIKILSGIFSGTTTGAPISLMIENKDQFEEVPLIVGPWPQQFKGFKKSVNIYKIVI